MSPLAMEVGVISAMAIFAFGAVVFETCWAAFVGRQLKKHPEATLLDYYERT